MPHVTSLRTEDPDRVGRYRLAGRISGMPGTGPVFVATSVDGTEVVVRLLRGGWTRDPAERDRFAAEASSAAQVPPFCAARIVDAGVQGDYAFLISEYVAGRSLLETVSDDGPFPGLELEALAIGSATGLASVHQAGLVHGNFGPEYVVMSASGPRVIEYGITPPYGSATPSADMLAWAQTMVFAAIGRPPATYADLDSLPMDLRDSVAECLSGDPSVRPSARSVVLDLLGGVVPVDRALPEGARRVAAALAARLDSQRPAPAPASAVGSPLGKEQTAVHQGNATHLAPHKDGRGRPLGRPSRRRASVWAAASGVVVIAVVLFVVVSLAGSGRPGAGGRAQCRSGPSCVSTRPVSSTGSGRTSHRPTGPITVPATFSGSWTGQARQVSPPDEFQVKLTLPSGVSDGNIAYANSSFSCLGQLSPDSVGNGTLTLDQGITSGRHTCANGTVVLTPGSNGTLRFTFHGKTGPVATGILTRS